MAKKKMTHLEKVKVEHKKRVKKAAAAQKVRRAKNPAGKPTPVKKPKVRTPAERIKSGERIKVPKLSSMLKTTVAGAAAAIATYGLDVGIQAERDKPRTRIVGRSNSKGEVLRRTTTIAKEQRTQAVTRAYSKAAEKAIRASVKANQPKSFNSSLSRNTPSSKKKVVPSPAPLKNNTPRTNHHAGIKTPTKIKSTFDGRMERAHREALAIKALKPGKPDKLDPTKFQNAKVAPASPNKNSGGKQKQTINIAPGNPKPTRLTAASGASRSVAGKVKKVSKSSGMKIKPTGPENRYTKGGLFKAGKFGVFGGGGKKTAADRKAIAARKQKRMNNR